MSAPHWVRWLLRLVTPPHSVEDVLGDLEETHRARVARRGRLVAHLLTGLEALDVAFALLRERMRLRRTQEGGEAPVGSAIHRSGRSGGISVLDVKLGIRMLARNPALSLVGGLGMAVAIALGAGSYALISGAFDSTLPFDPQRRVVAIELWDAEINNQEPQVLHDFAVWREQLESIEVLGAWRSVGRNLITANGMAGPVSVAEMTASGFDIAGAPPIMGRYLLPDDEQPGAPPVVVLGYALWQSRFLGAPDIVGSTIGLGEARYTVVGVMPQGFEFPRSHQLWTALRAASEPWQPREGPDVFVFGRLAPGATVTQARAELAMLERRIAAASPETHAHLSAQLVPYTTQFLDDGDIRNAHGWQVQILQLPFLLLLGVICVNVAILVYARTVTRHGEIAIRTALGASRRRIVAQLFAESLVLTAGAAAVGLAVAAFGLRQIEELLEAITFIPYWMDFDLSPATFVYAATLSILAAVLVGVLPALNATGSRMRSSLQELGGASGVRMGRTWSALIVAQVAIAVVLLPTATWYGGEFLRYGLRDPGFPAEEYLTAWLVLDRGTGLGTDSTASSVRLADRLDRLERQLEAEPLVGSVTFASDLEGGRNLVRIEVEDLPLPPESPLGHRVAAQLVTVDFFDVFDLGVVAGRGFNHGDVEENATTVVVNRAFAQQVLGGSNAVGRRLRYSAGYRAGGIVHLPQGVQRDAWYEIVGVVEDLIPEPLEPDVPTSRIYHARALGQVHPVTLALHMRQAAPSAFVSRLRDVAGAVDPGLQVREILPLDEVLDVEQRAMRLGALGIVAAMACVLLLSAAGIHALMAFTVARRRREIGIRSALGGGAGRVLAGIFRRAAMQLGAGALAGLVLAGLLDLATGGEMLGGRAVLLLPGVAAFMVAVGLLAAAGPALRGLRVEPTEALRADG